MGVSSFFHINAGGRVPGLFNVRFPYDLIIWACLQEMLVPYWIRLPPKNLASHAFAMAIVVPISCGSDLDVEWRWHVALILSSWAMGKARYRFSPFGHMTICYCL